MANVAVTYSFTNGTTADASQVNQNFTDIINGTSDGTKDFSIAALTAAGNVSFTGSSITLGNASGDDLTITASLASTINVKTTASYDIGSSTIGLLGIYFGRNSQTVRIVGSSSMSATWTLTLPVTAGTANYVLKTDGSGVSSWSTVSPTVIAGATTGTSPAAGFIGERISAAGSNVAMVTTAGTTVATLSLTAGIWDVSATFIYEGGSAQNFVTFGICPSAATFTGTTLGVDKGYFAVSANATGGGAIANKRVETSGTPTYYLVGQVSTTNSAGAYATISATRVA